MLTGNDSTSLIKGDGTEIKGRDNVVEALKQLYGPFTAQYHEPSFVMCSETDDGWEMLGQATLFVNLPGEPAAGEKKVKDASGKEWDTGVPSGFHFYYKKDDNADNGLGMYFKRTEISKLLCSFKIRIGNSRRRFSLCQNVLLAVHFQEAQTSRAFDHCALRLPLFHVSHAVPDTC